MMGAIGLRGYVGQVQVLDEMRNRFAREISPPPLHIRMCIMPAGRHHKAVNSIDWPESSSRETFVIELHAASAPLLNKAMRY